MIGYRPCNEKISSVCCCWYWSRGINFQRKW